MALRGKSFSVDTVALDRLVNNIIREKERADKRFMQKMSQATGIIFKIATTRRPMITKAQMKAEGRKFRVSDPEAELGVPVAAIDGGSLQASIKQSTTQKGDKITGRVWTSMSYAKYLEFGTSKMQARPFMRPALNLTKDAIKRMLAKK